MRASLLIFHSELQGNPSRGSLPLSIYLAATANELRQRSLNKINSQMRPPNSFIGTTIVVVVVDGFKFDALIALRLVVVVELTPSLQLN